MVKTEERVNSPFLLLIGMGKPRQRRGRRGLPPTSFPAWNTAPEEDGVELRRNANAEPRGFLLPFRPFNGYMSTSEEQWRRNLVKFSIHKFYIDEIDLVEIDLEGFDIGGNTNPQKEKLWVEVVINLLLKGEAMVKPKVHKPSCEETRIIPINPETILVYAVGCSPSSLQQNRCGMLLWLPTAVEKDKLQLFDLHVKANEIKQNGMSLEDIWIVLQGIWGEIERRDPNPMKCSTDISIHNRIRAEQKLFQCDPLPSSEAAYATVRKDTAHQKILGATSDTTAPQGIVTGLVVNPPGESEGTSLVSKGQRRPYKQPEKQDKSHLKCEHCRKTRHTKEQCFKLVGYPEWWIDGSKKGNSLGKPSGSQPNSPNIARRRTSSELILRTHLANSASATASVANRSSAGIANMSSASAGVTNMSFEVSATATFSVSEPSFRRFRNRNRLCFRTLYTKSHADSRPYPPPYLNQITTFPLPHTSSFFMMRV
ncbi:hypothetical protein LXL04_025212 [Taraxacum kok-saghyz]